jgi:hypothetical protein
MPTPSEGQVLLLRAVLHARRGRPGIDDRIADAVPHRHRQGRPGHAAQGQQGAMGRTPLAATRRAEFEDAINAGAQRVWKASTNARPRVKTNFY